MRSYTFRVFMNTYEKHEAGCGIYTTAGHCDGKSCNQTGHQELGAYVMDAPPWVPPVGSYFRFLDSHPPNKPFDAGEKKGYVEAIVTCFYGANTVIEVYLRDAGP